MSSSHFPRYLRSRSFRSCGFALAVAALLAYGSAALGQAPHPLTPAEQSKVDDLVHRMTLDQKLDYIGGTGFAIRAVPALALPALEMSDGPYGTRSNEGFPSTTYTAGIGLAATWDRELAERVGSGIGRDARARGVHFMLGPGVNIYRSPRNGRNFEYLGEDPFLASRIAAAYITGMQAEGVSATIKHFLGNNSEFLRHDSDSVIDERTLREIYLPTFEYAVKYAHVGSIMDSYNLINGAHATQNGYFNTEIARKQWGFPGIMMSDWSATYDGIAAANGGLDLEMPTGKFMNRANLADAVRSGKVPEAIIDEKVRRILSTAESFGWLDRTQADPSISYADARNRAIALDSARESAVLLKNTGAVLPLDKSQIKTLLVVGPDAYPGAPVGGGSAGVVPFHLVSTLEGLENGFAPQTNVFYDRGLPRVEDVARETSFTTAANGGKPGLTREIFANASLDGTPLLTGVVEHVNASGMDIEAMRQDPAAMSALMSGDHKPVSRRFTGFFNAPAAGRYILVLEGTGENAGNRVTLDGKVVVDNWKLVRAFQSHVTLDLSAGPHKVVVEDWRANGMGGRLRLAIADESKIVNQRARELAGTADAVVVSVGFAQEGEGEGGDRTFALPFGQDELILAMAALNPETVVDITSGGNVDSAAWIDRVPALIESWYAGEQAGTAFAEILTGQVNPSGHLPVTFERRAEDNPAFANYYPEGDTRRVVYKEGIFVGYRGYEHNGTAPLFPFGFGLSYTTFSFANLVVSPASAGSNPEVQVTFDVTNTGQRAGAEVAQVYVSEVRPKLPRPAHELKGFERVTLVPGETKHVFVALDARSFAFYDVGKKNWAINPGKFTIQVGDSVASLPLESSIDLTPAAATSSF